MHRKLVGRVTVGLLAAGMLTTVAVFGSVLAPHIVSPVLDPVNAPLASAVPGTRFSPGSPLPDAVAPSGDGAAKEAVEALPPKSAGTHVTASLARRDGSFLVAVWGDPILWERRERNWRPAPDLPRLTGSAAEVVALAEDRLTGHIRIGTRREGSFVAEGGVWKPIPRPNAPYDADAQALIAYRGTLFAATLNDGLVLRDNHGTWSRIAPPRISTNAPRQFLIWRDNLYVRHGNGVVDRFDGLTWRKDVFTTILPRRQVSCMATDGRTFFLGQWGGWSETSDERRFINHFPADLSRLPITAILPLKDSLYVGTQGRGLAECDPQTGEVRRWHDERNGIADDWITTLCLSAKGSVIAGTFVSGAFERENDTSSNWRALPGTGKDCVTGAIVAPSGPVFLALRREGIRCFSEGKEGQTLASLPEAQCLLFDRANNLLWVGTRTGIIAVSAAGSGRGGASPSVGEGSR